MSIFLRTVSSRIGSVVLGCLKLKRIAGDVRRLMGSVCLADGCFVAVSAT